MLSAWDLFGLTLHSRQTKNNKNRVKKQFLHAIFVVSIHLQEPLKTQLFPFGK